MWTTTTIDDLRTRRRALTGTVAFVPTMGALHAGHVSLIHAAKQLADHVLVSVYVNPTQFGPSEDLTKYPRTLKEDMELCEAAGAAGVFRPGDQVMYPQQIACEVNVPQLVTMLEGEHRPGHFAGVCRVVAKLFNMVQPDVACFGRKDFQQLKVIEAMTRDLAMPIRIVGCPTLRDPDGMAMSSRNRYLTPDTRKRGLGLFKALSEARAMVEEQGETDPAAVEGVMHTVLASHKVAIDYTVIRHPQTLAAIDCIEPALTGGVVALVAGRVDDVRLIDNMILAER
ncbi:MAG: pantoate--beta-alanine ligase [Phycisphaeraceae bacterium]